MKRGPKGADIETQLEVIATRTWRLELDVLRKRLGLPEDARISASNGEGASFELGPVGHVIATATEVRTPKVTT